MQWEGRSVLIGRRPLFNCKTRMCVISYTDGGLGRDWLRVIHQSVHGFGLVVTVTVGSAFVGSYRLTFNP